MDANTIAVDRQNLQKWRNWRDFPEDARLRKARENVGQSQASKLLMGRSTSELLDFAKRMIALDANGSTTSDLTIPTACVAGEKLRSHLATLLGSIGVKALLSRALALANAEVPWLRTVHIKNDGSLEGFEQLAAQMDSDQFSEGCAILLSHLLGLLVAFIGEELTLRLVGDVWPGLRLDNGQFGKGDEK